MISLAMIVKDGATTLKSALHSASHFCQEIIVVDTGSLDESPQIAKDQGARLFTYKWENDFSSARNFAIAQATQPWVFVLDADEMIAQADSQWFAKQINALPKKAFSFETRNYFSSYPSIPGTVHLSPNFPPDIPPAMRAPYYAPSSKVRLFPRLPGLLFSHPIHETLEPALLAEEMTITTSPIPVHHFGYLQSSQESQTAKGELYLRILEKSHQKNPKDPKTIFDLAYQYFLIEDVEACQRCLEQLTNDSFPDVLVDVLRAECALKRNQLPEAIEICEKASKAHLHFGALQKVLACCYEKWKDGRIVLKFSDPW